MKPLLLMLGFLFANPHNTQFVWGFHAHRLINEMAVYTLPVEMAGFYKSGISYLKDHAIDADKRRYAIENEAPRHYIDLDEYGEHALDFLPTYWNQAVDSVGESVLLSHGIVPWYTYSVFNFLTKALKDGDYDKVLKYSADLGHYVADANVPLHTTSNYNGQLTNQHGIHGFWESRLPELFSAEYKFWVGRAQYLDYPQQAIWETVMKANMALDSVLSMEKDVSVQMNAESKYSYEQRGRQTVRVYSYDFSEAYHAELDGMVERQMMRSVKLLGDLWYTAWVNAGQPDLPMSWDLGVNDQGMSSDSLHTEHESGVLLKN